MPVRPGRESVPLILFYFNFFFAELVIDIDGETVLDGVDRRREIINDREHPSRRRRRER